MNIKNILKNIPENFSDEFIEVLLSNKNIRIERIVSKGHASPPGFWYDQEENEFVFILSGKAKLLFEDNKLITLKPGEYLNIPAHIKHRIEWTLPKKNTIWLAVFY